MLLDLSLDYLPKIRVPNSLWSKFLAASGDKIGLGCAVGFSLHFMERYKSLIVITAFTFGSALNVTMKMFYHEVRPYMLSESVIPAKCKMQDYGMPSGHTMVFISVYLTFVRLINTKY